MIKNLALLLSSGFFAQIINILSIPIITRIYSSDDIGLLSLFMSIVIVISSFATFRLELAIPKQKNSKNYNLISNIAVLSVSFISLFLVLICFFIDKISFTLSLVIAGYSISNAIYIIGVYLFTSYGMFKSIGISNVLKAVIVNGLQIGIGYIYQDDAKGYALIFSAFIGTFLISLIILYKLREEFKFSRKNNAFKSIGYVFKKEKDVMVFSTAQNLVNSVSFQSLTFFLGYFYNTSIVGMLTIAIKPMQVLSQQISEPFRQIFYNKAGEIIRQKQLISNYLFKTIASLFIISIAAMSPFYFFSEEIIITIFGEKWVDAHVYCQTFSFLFALMIINPPATAYLNLINKNKVIFIVDAASLFFRVIFLLFFGINDPETAAKLFVGVGVISNLSLLCFSIVFSLKNDKFIKI
ncbi:oligosaccharide flippase family protein [Vibrio cyclitrophicus]